jgi:hypothetical protein
MKVTYRFGCKVLRNISEPPWVTGFYSFIPEEYSFNYSALLWDILFGFTNDQTYTYNPVIQELKARILELAQTTVARERPCERHVTNGYLGDRVNVTIKELWEAVFSVGSAQRFCKESQLGLSVLLWVEAEEESGRGVSVFQWTWVSQWSHSQSQSQSHNSTYSQSVSVSWCRAPSGAHYQILVPVLQLLSCPFGAHSLTRRRVCRLSESEDIGRERRVSPDDRI